jgi:multiple sugar transport system substrate-binding protein
MKSTTAPSTAAKAGSTKRRARLAAAVAATAAFALVLTGCSSGSSSASSGSGAKVTSIDYWTPPQAGKSESGTKAILAPLIAKFKKETGITVNVQVYDWSNILNKITAGIAAGTGPDVAAGGNTWNGIYASTGGVESWTPSMIKAIGGKSQFIPAFLETAGYPGKAPISIPEGGGTWQMVYNKKILADAGITTMPKTWDEFIADAQKTTNPATGVWGTGQDLANVSNMTTFDWILMRQYGGDFFDSKGKAAANSPANVNAMSFFLDWMQKDKIMSPQDASYNASQAEEDFNAGKTAFLITESPSAITMPADQFGTALVPMRSATPPKSQAIMSHIAGENVIILKSSKKQDADLKWIKFLLTPSVNIDKNAANGSIPTVTAAASSPKFANPLDKTQIQIVKDYAAPQQINSDDGPLEQAFARAVGQLFGQAATGQTVTDSQVKSALDGVQSAALSREASQ